MNSWREAWSTTPHTTSPDAPFGIVQLADATDEGWGCNIRQMHQAETGNYGAFVTSISGYSYRMFHKGSWHSQMSTILLKQAKFILTTASACACVCVRIAPGVVPNPAFKNAFVAAAHDLGEPWDDGCKGAPHFCCTVSAFCADRVVWPTFEPTNRLYFSAMTMVALVG